MQVQGKDHPVQYAEFHHEFGVFLKEGVCTDFAHKVHSCRSYAG